MIHYNVRQNTMTQGQCLRELNLMVSYETLFGKEIKEHDDEECAINETLE